MPERTRQRPVSSTCNGKGWLRAGLVGPALCLVLVLLSPSPAAMAAEKAAEEAAAGRSAPEDALWTRLLERCVQRTPDGGSTAVDYRCFAQRRSELDRYLASLSAIDADTFGHWSRDARLAFLINAYNAFTVELILTAWPDLDSIRDLGGLFSSPWKKPFIALLGDRISLDDIEHGMIREPGQYDEPRIHFAVNCASIGCPALRREAYRGPLLESQLEDQTVQFLGDRSRNRLRDGRLEVSPLFKWYREDFEGGWRGVTSLRAFLARYADALDLDDVQRSRLVGDGLPLRFLDYDWSLNERPAPVP
jgi:hypothetical protein